LLVVLLAYATALTACGGGGNSGGGGGGGVDTQPVTGTVTIVATGSSNNVTQSVTVSLTVQ
jgi:hypothetical protein